MNLIAPSASDRILEGLRSIIAAQFPTFIYSGPWEYTITSATSSTVDCAPLITNAANPPSVPSLKNVPFKSSILGEQVTPKVGAICVVEFMNQDPTRPRITSIDPVPIVATVDATSIVNVGPSSAMVALAGGANALVIETSYTATVGAVTTFAETLYSTIGSLPATTPIMAIMLQDAVATLLTSMQAISVAPQSTTRTRAT